MNEIFYEFKEVKKSADISSEIIVEIVLHFLAKLQDQGNIALIETKITATKAKNSNLQQEVFNELQKVFKEFNPQLALIKGKIREIFLSYSS